jgi:hypothetical protein
VCTTALQQDAVESDKRSRLRLMLRVRKARVQYRLRAVISPGRFDLASLDCARTVAPQAMMQKGPPAMRFLKRLGTELAPFNVPNVL